MAYLEGHFTEQVVRSNKRAWNIAKLTVATQLPFVIIVKRFTLCLL